MAISVNERQPTGVNVGVNFVCISTKLHFRSNKSRHLMPSDR